jgi:hypothetical protein
VAIVVVSVGVGSLRDRKIGTRHQACLALVVRSSSPQLAKRRQGAEGVKASNSPLTDTTQGVKGPGVSLVPHTPVTPPAHSRPCPPVTNTRPSPISHQPQRWPQPPATSRHDTAPARAEGRRGAGHDTHAEDSCVHRVRAPHPVTGRLGAA